MKDTEMNDIEREAVFCVADMSGYTRFIFSNEKEISHSQMVIRELITTLLGEVNLPLRLVRRYPQKVCKQSGGVPSL